MGRNGFNVIESYGIWHKIQCQRGSIPPASHEMSQYQSPCILFTCLSIIEYIFNLSVRNSEDGRQFEHVNCHHIDPSYHLCSGSACEFHTSSHLLYWALRGGARNSPTQIAHGMLKSTQSITIRNCEDGGQCEHVNCYCIGCSAG